MFQSPLPESAIIALVILGLVVLFAPGPGLRGSLDAWRRAAGFFAVSYSVVTLTLSRIAVPSQVLPTADLDWLIASGCYLLLVVVGYGLVWPQGTVAHGRPLRPAFATLFGLLWGLAQSGLFLSIWLWIGALGLNPWWTAVLAYFGIAAYQGLWHGLFWDIKVSPPHNLRSWNAKKVALVHTPNLLVTVVYLASFGMEVAWVVVLAQTIALLLSAWFMHFPAPLDEPAPVPEPDD